MIVLRRLYVGVSEARKLDVYCWPAAGLTYPFGFGRRFRMAWPVGSNRLWGMMFPGNWVVVPGMRIGITAPEAFLELEKLPPNSRAVGSLVATVTVDWSVLVNSWDIKKNSLVLSL